MPKGFTWQASEAQLVLFLQDADGKLDVLINNAGVLEEWKSLNDSVPAEWWGSYEVNVRGTYLSVKAVLPSMLKNGGGTIINLSSGGALVTVKGASACEHQGEIALLAPGPLLYLLGARLLDMLRLTILMQRHLWQVC